MSKMMIIGSNAVAAKLYDAPEAAQDLVNQTLSFIVEGVGASTAFTSNADNGKSSFWSYATQSFPAGFVNLVHNTLVAKGYRVQLVRNKPLPAPLGPENPIVDEFGNDDPRYDFQLEALRQVEKHGAGIIQVATGGGKSKIAKLIVARFRRPTLFLTTRSVLMHQMKGHFEGQGFNVGVIGDGEWKIVRGVNVGMVQTLVAHLKVEPVERIQRRLIAADFPGALPEIKAEAYRILDEQQRKRARAIKLLEIFEVVIGEEAHEAGGDSYFTILQACRNAAIRVALTATPFMRADEQDNMRLYGAFGPVLLKVSEKTLIDRGILATPYFKFVTSRSPDKLKASTGWARAYELGFTENPFLNADIVADAVMAKRYGLPVMTLVQRVPHGKILEELMEAAGLRVAFIRGENDNKQRRAALERLAKGDIDALIGTNILDVGVDVPAVGLVQLAGGGKAEVGHRQRIGRGLRAKKRGPNACFIADYSTGLNSHHRGHTAQRRAIVEATEGFNTQILAPGIDFPWGMFDPALSRAA